MVDRFSFGVATGAVMEVAYVVRDLESEMDRYVRALGVGPFFYIPHFPLIDVEYRGRSASLDLDVALAFSGSLCIELIRQNDDAPSVFQEVVEARGYGFHHWAVATKSYDADIARHESERRGVASSATAALGGRMALIDTFASLGGMIEIIEMTPAGEEFFTMVHAAAASWDGRDPVRTLGPPVSI